VERLRLSLGYSGDEWKAAMGAPEAELADRRAGRLRRWTKQRRDFGRVTRRCAGGISR